MQAIDTVFYIAILLMSVVIHEVSHGHIANLFGDSTARYAGRLTLNPLKHLDPFGSIILPVALVLMGATPFGWAKPVPVNPYNLRDQRLGTFLVGAAGVIANFLVAIVFGLVLRFSAFSGAEILSSPFLRLVTMIVGLNLILGIFNLIPVPPLDGSKVLFAFLPYRFQHIQGFFETYWPALLFLVLWIAPKIVIPLLILCFYLITGHSAGLYFEALAG